MCQGMVRFCYLIRHQSHSQLMFILSLGKGISVLDRLVNATVLNFPVVVVDEQSSLGLLNSLLCLTAMTWFQLKALYVDLNYRQQRFEILNKDLSVGIALVHCRLTEDR